MTDATYTADAGSIAGFAQVMDALVVITSGDVSNAQTTTCTLTVETDLGILVAVFTGTDFVYDEDSSLAGGTITGVSFTLDNVHQGDITTSLPVSDALQAAIAEENGDYAAIEHFFMSFNWTYHGNDLGEVADSSDVVGDDIPFNPTGNDTIFLNGGDDVFYSGDGSDTISGGAGNDVLDGGNGSDTINGGDGNDEIHGGNGADILNGNADDDILYGDAGNDTIDGGDGSDELYGGAALDHLYGGSGDDTLTGGGGNDTIDGGDDFDDVWYAGEGGGAGVSVDLAAGQATDTYGDTDILIGIEGMAGTNHDDVLRGDDGDNIIRSLRGNDTVDGRGGSDEIHYGGDHDVLYVEVDLVDGTGIEHYADGITTDTLTSIERIRGSHGNDTLYGDDNDNIIKGLAGDDAIDGRGGIDAVDYHNDANSGGGAGVEVDLSTGTAIDGFGDTDTLTNIEDVRGTRFDDIITGDSGSNLLVGDDGNDVLNGGGVASAAFSDFLDGGAGDDTLTIVGQGQALGGEGNDRIIGETSGDPDNIDYAEVLYVTSTAGIVANLTATSHGGLGGGNTTSGFLVSDGLGGTDRISGLHVLTGSDFDDTIYVDSSWTNSFGSWLEVRLGAGNDRVEGDGTAIIRVTYGDADGAVNVNLATGTATDANPGDHFIGTDTLIGVTQVRGSSFDDTITGDGNDNQLRGRDGNDHLYGGAGNDVLYGDEKSASPFVGNDYLDGGTGADQMFGGAGNDTYVVDNAGDVVDESVAGSDGFDRVQSSISLNLADTVHFKGDIEAGVLTGTANLNLAGNGLNNLLIGNAGDNFINGGAGNDTLQGGAGSDIMQGGIGADTMQGGAGNDTYVVDNAGDIVDESVAGSDGFDKVQSSISLNLADTVHFKGDIEAGVLTGTANLNLAGNDLNNLLIGNAGDNFINGGAGNDTMQGGAGSDIMQGGIGADTMQGGAGNDTYVVDNAGDIVDESVAGSDGFDKVQSSISLNLADTVHFKGDIEAGVLTGTANLNLAGNDLNNLLIGNAGDNFINGGAGNDTLQGGAGSDIMQGGIGADTMQGGAGNDTYVVDNAGDIVDESVAGSDGFDKVQSSISLNLADTVHFKGDIEAGVLTGTANLNLAGNDLNNLLIGNAGDNFINGGAGNDTMQGGAGSDIMQGGIGADTMQGGAGNDTYVVDNAGDIVDESVAGSDGFDKVQSSISLNLADTVHFKGDIEAGVLTGTANLNLAGNGLNNLLIGNAGDNFINGGAGNDTMQGGAGSDIMQGGIGADTMQGGAGNDTYVVDNAGDIVDESVTGSDGFDKVQSSISLNLADTVHFKGDIEAGVLTGTANLNLAGNGLNNLLIGNAGDNFINGGAGNDTMQGGAGSDIMQGGIGADTMQGGAGNDTYVVDNAGDIVDESVAGSDGFDKVQSSISLNLADTVHFKGDIEAGVLTGTANLNLAGNDLNNLLIGNAGDNFINGGAGNDTLQGGAGHDTFAFTTALHNTANVDVITDFVSGDDTIQLASAIFTALTATGTLAASAFAIGAAATPNQHILYNETNGWLSYDADGSGAGAAIHFATLSTHPTISNTDFVVV